jgi:hypothetical protein
VTARSSRPNEVRCNSVNPVEVAALRFNKTEDSSPLVTMRKVSLAT